MLIPEASIRVWLCDLTYTQMTIASDVVPAAVGGIAEFCYANWDSELPHKNLSIEIIKYPEQVIELLESGDIPNVVGFGAYVWNDDLSYQMAQFIRHKTGAIIVFGGPSIPSVSPVKPQVIISSDNRQNADFKEYADKKQLVDFFVLKEGEVPFLLLLRTLSKANLDRILKEPVDGIVGRDQNNSLLFPNQLTRMRDLSEIPSPYLSKTMDRYLEDGLLPIIQTNRGCPFSCTFCTEGQDFWNKVKRKPTQTIRDELHHIASYLKKKHDSRSDLLIADSNFGMYKDDLEVANVIAKNMAEFDYPKFINVATGKNKKENVLEAARILNGALKLSGSVQTLDPEVSKNIKRNNISASQILELALEGNAIGASTYSEVILGLPGDTRETHIHSINQLMDADFETISMYQLMLLSGTEMATEFSRRKWGMKTAFRVIPRCAGIYRTKTTTIKAMEIEEICVSTSDLSYDDYLYCRNYHLFVNIFYNDKIFYPILALIKSNQGYISDFLNSFFKYLMTNKTSLTRLFEEFQLATRSELAESSDDVSKLLDNAENIADIEAASIGKNLIFFYKSRFLLEFIEPAVEEIVGFAIVNQFISETQKRLLRQLGDYVICRYSKIIPEVLEGKKHNLYRVKMNREAAQFLPDLNWNATERSETFCLEFAVAEDTRKEINSYASLFGIDAHGVSRMISRLRLNQLGRTPNVT